MIYIVRSKACKRCGGDLSLECDIYGVYAECIQCGASWSKRDMMTLNTIRNVKRPNVATSKPLVPTRRR